ncbi:MAG: glycosyltransferase [Chloroflexota bacterium]|nr:glycosyltransferase [Chloroflexota bacterium]
MRGSVGDHTARLATKVAEQGHEVGVLTSIRARDGEDREGLRIWPLMEHWGLSAWPALFEVVREYEVLHLEYQAGAFGMGLAPQFLADGVRLLTGGKPFVTTFHDLLVPYLFPKAGRFREWSVRHLARASDAVVVTNAEDAAIVREWGVHRLRQIPIASPLPLELSTDWDRDAWRARWQVGPEQKLIVHFGFINRAKGVEALLRAYDGLLRAGQPYRLLMAGDPLGASDPSNRHYLAEVEALAEELNLHEPWLKWTGDLSEEELIQAILAADLIVLPYRDGASLRRSTLIMSLSLGRPVITTQPTTPIPFLKDGENIAFVRPDDPSDLARRIALLLRYEPTLRRLERGAHELRRYFDWERIAQQYIDLYQSLLDGTSSELRQG